MKKRFLYILLFSIFFIGCSQKTNRYAKPTDILHEQALTQTQKVQIKKQKKTKIYFIITYISRIDSDLLKIDNLVDKFIVSAYIPSDEDKENYKKIFFKIDRKDPIAVDELKKDSDLLSLLFSSTSWSRYYLVQAPVDSSKQGVLFEVGVKNLGSAKVEFHDKYGNLPMQKIINLSR